VPFRKKSYTIGAEACHPLKRPDMILDFGTASAIKANFEAMNFNSLSAALTIPLFFPANGHL